MLDIYFWFISSTLLGFTLLPLIMTIVNLRLFRRCDKSFLAERTMLSVLIPARNEEQSIGRALRSIQQNDYSNFEVLVLDDASVDGTACEVEKLGRNDPKIRLHRSESLASGWNGKQFACWQLANLAKGELFLFLDADVRLSPNAISRLVTQYESQQVGLLSGFPRQETGSVSERLLIPMMYVLLLGYLPIARSRNHNDPSLAAGCGQMFLCSRESYFAADGHRSIASSRHDGIQLPRSFRRANQTTDFIDASDIARCRMYEDLNSVTCGLLKNATEGIAKMPHLIIFTILLLGGFVLPLAMFAHAIFWRWPLPPTALLSLATSLSLMPRILIANRLESSYLGAVLNPFAVVWFLVLQWLAFFRQRSGYVVAWRGRQT